VERAQRKFDLESNEKHSPFFVFIFVFVVGVDEMVIILVSVLETI